MGPRPHVNFGRNNFDELRFEYFRDSTVAIEAFKARPGGLAHREQREELGDRLRFSRHVSEKRVLLEEFPDPQLRESCRRFALNIRRDKFKDPRVRRALNFAFDFEEMNKQIFFGQYKRIVSYFDGTEACWPRVCRKGKELEILEPLRDQVPAEVFTTPYTNPVGGSPEAVRDNLREALRLLKDAGYEVRDQQAGRCQDRQRSSRSNC